MTRRRYDLTLSAEIADQVNHVIQDEQIRNVENYMPPRPTGILESLIRMGLELRRARQNLGASYVSEKPQKRPVDANRGW